MDRSWIKDAQETYPAVLFDFRVHLRLRHPVWSAHAIRKGILLPATDEDRWSVGRRRMTPSGRPLPGVYKEPLVSLDFEGQPQEDLAECLLRVARELGRHERFFRRLRGSGGSLELFVGVFVEGNKGFTLDVELLNKLAALGIELGLDLYDGPSNWAGDSDADR